MTPPRADGGAAPSGSATVELRLFATFREAVGRKTLERTYAEPVTVRQVLADLEVAHPALEDALLDGSGELRPSVCIVRNGRNVVHLDGVDTVLADGDTVAVMPPVSGGAGRAELRGGPGSDAAGAEPGD